MGALTKSDEDLELILSSVAKFQDQLKVHNPQNSEQQLRISIDRMNQEIKNCKLSITNKAKALIYKFTESSKAISEQLNSMHKKIESLAVNPNA